MRRLLALAAVILGALAMAAPAGAHVRIYRLASYPAQRAQTTTLITPEGQPVGGPWQRWLNQSHAPTYRGNMVLDISEADVNHWCQWTSAWAGACTSAHSRDAVLAVDPLSPETIMRPYLPDVSQSIGEWWTLRDALYYEQGHAIDFAYLTDADRTAFLHLWGRNQMVTDWWTGEAGLGSGAQVPAGEMFAEGYRVCAEGLSLAQEPYLVYQLVDASQRDEDRFCRMVVIDIKRDAN